MLDLNRSLPPTRESVVAIARGQLGESDASVYWRDSEHMAPGLKVNHLPHGALANTKAPCEGNGGFTESVCSARFPHQFRIELRAPHFRSASVPLDTPTLGHHVRDIISLGTLEAVARVYTGRVVASMTEVFAREFTSNNSPRNTVGESRPVRVAKKPISVPVSVSSPKPTAVCLLDSTPETCDQVFIHGNSIAVGHDPGRSNVAGSTRWSLPCWT